MDVVQPSRATASKGTKLVAKFRRAPPTDLFSRAMKELLLAEPWRLLTEMETLRLDLPTAGLQNACLCVHGALGEAPGFSVFCAPAPYTDGEPPIIWDIAVLRAYTPKNGVDSSLSVDAAGAFGTLDARSVQAFGAAIARSLVAFCDLERDFLRRDSFEEEVLHTYMMPESPAVKELRIGAPHPSVRWPSRGSGDFDDFRLAAMGPPRPPAVDPFMQA